MSVEAPSAVISTGTGPIVNEGPVGPDFRLEDNMTLVQNKPLHIRQAEEIVDSTWNSPLETNEEIKPVITAVIEHPINKAKVIWEQLRDQESLTPQILDRAILAAQTINRVNVQPEIKGAQRVQEGFPTPQTLQAKEQIIFKRRANQISHLSKEQDVQVKDRMFVLDERALGQRIVEITQAVRKANEWAFGLGTKITGYLVARFLPGQHPGNESEAIRGRGPDGSILELHQAIGEQGEYASDLDAEEKSIKEAYEKPPVKLRREGEGEPVKDEDVERVFQGLDPDLAEVFK